MQLTFRTVAVAVMLLVSAPAWAGSVEDAEKLAADAQVQFDAGQFQQALDLFTQAYSTFPKARYVFSIANCYEKLGNLPRALDAYEMFTQYEPTPEVLGRVESETKKLKGLLAQEHGEVFIFSSPSGAQIIIGEISKQNVYQTPTRRWLKEGEHSIFFKKDKCAPREMRLTVKKGEHVYIYAGLKEEK
ncbi:MAG: tetratricopeptide repeat protein [Deltaproteobacteria bacterium]|nr:tetratricopeptide repeat protein [Deltaproteobacteria bacterium]